MILFFHLKRSDRKITFNLDGMIGFYYPLFLSRKKEQKLFFIKFLQHFHVASMKQLVRSNKTLDNSINCNNPLNENKESIINSINSQLIKRDLIQKKRSLIHV
jgi:hypothetical protein